MSGSIARVVQRLLTLIGAVDTGAVAANRARVDAQHARAAYAGAGQGSRNVDLRQAVTDAATAEAKLGKVARLLSEAAGAFADYVNDVAPGSAPTRVAAESAHPSGEQVATDAAERARRFRRFTRRSTEKADDVADTAKNLAELIRGPSGGTEASQQVPQAQPQQQPVGQGDLASSLAVVGIMGAAVGYKIREMLQNRARHHTNRDAEDGDTDGRSGKSD